MNTFILENLKSCFLGIRSFIISCITWFLFATINLYGQNKPIEHIVKTGDNVYRLSLKYGVSINDIYKLNPSSKELIKIGETLLIPSNSSSTSASIENFSRDRYIVQKSETKYGLSKRFGISIAELEEANPIIKNGLQAGHQLKIPTSNDDMSNTSVSDTTHKVLKGETLWGISRQYNMSVDELKNLNQATLKSVLLEGQVLMVNSNQYIPQNNTYTVQKGDTKFGLSKKFDTTIAELERLNPSIVDLLMAGDVIVYKESNNQIPSDSAKAVVKADIGTTSEDPIQNKTSNWYVIQPKETLYSLSKKTDMTVDELTTLNPKLKQFVHAGDSIRIKNPITSEIVSSPIVAKTASEFNTKVFWQNTYQNSNDNSSKDISDYDNGIQNAINNLSKNQSLENVRLLTMGDSDSVFNSLAPETSKNFHLRPVPNFENHISELGDFTLRYLDNGTVQTRYIKSLVSERQMRIKMLSYLNSQNANIICIYDDDSSENIALLQNYIPNIKLIKLNNNGTLKPNALKNILDTQQKNFVIIESEKNGVFLSSTTILLKELSKFDIQLAVLNANNIPLETDVSFKRFKILKLLYPMAYNPNFIDKANLIQQIGYITNYDILNRISLQGINAFNDSSEILGTHFKYVIVGDIIQNTAVSIYMYNENSEAELLVVY